MENKLTIIVESHVPYAVEALTPVARLRVLPSEEITPDAVRDVDAIITRTRTRCNAELLEDSRVTFVGTATIGTDHIDRDWCASHGIEVASAPGCNAPAVASWVMSSIAACHRLAPPTVYTGASTLGVVGVGHVGSIVARWAAQLGMRVMRCDPPRAAAEPAERFYTLDEVLDECDIITLHTPLTRAGDCPTWHMIDEAAIKRARRCRLLLNASRGPVCDTAALLQAPQQVMLAIDTWEGEPIISRALLERATVATPHIAGYSEAGKRRATAMVLQALARHFNLDITVDMPFEPATGAPTVDWQRVTSCYDPIEDTATLRHAPERFETLRDTYRLRPEVI